jgi:hypothetical protein
MNSNKKICVFMSKVYAKGKRIWLAMKIINVFNKIQFNLTHQEKHVEAGIEEMSNPIPPFWTNPTGSEKTLT